MAAGLLVEQGSLRLSGQSGMYIYKVLRKGVSVSVVEEGKEVEEGGAKMVRERELVASKIKKFKDNVTEVRIMTDYEFIWLLYIVCLVYYSVHDIYRLYYDM